jgi:hypothetical protein
VANPYSRDAFFWGADADAQMRRQAFDKKAVVAVLGEKYFASEGQVKYKVQLEGMPLYKAVYATAEEVPAPMLQAWQGSRAPPSFYCKVWLKGCEYACSQPTHVLWQLLAGTAANATAKAEG